MRISAIVAMSENRVIGKDNQLLWHLPADLQHFKQVTMGKPILMGRKTYQSIGRPLPGRCNIVMTHDSAFVAEGCVIVDSMDAALAVVKESDEIFIIGGAIVYRQLLSFVQRIYMTVVHHEFAGDAFFPELNLAEWQETARERHAADEKHQYAFSFITWERKMVCY
ncbi:MAG: Dihydrofolate reductase [uncultured bacterium]|nr:MAG: Dihydrofolate reductase [uncultured bacterium]